MSDTEKASFWDIAKLVTPRRGGESPPRQHLSQSPAVQDSSRTVPPASSPEEVCHLAAVPSGLGDAEEHTYRPSWNPLLLSVTVRSRPSGYSFYEQFRRDALRLFSCEGGPAEYVPFFSFSPQYQQLTEDQRAYYLYFRTEARRSNFLRADKGYFFLLVYEIINLPERISPEEGARFLAALWGHYRASLSGIDRYMAVWLSDYCFLYGLACPPLTPECLAAAAATGEGIEFFFGNAAEASTEGMLRLLQLSSAYPFWESRALTEENRPFFLTHILGAMAEVFPRLFEEGQIGTHEGIRRITRRAFSGSLCSHNLRAELTLDYIALRHAEGFRRTVGLAVKYAENHVRALLGIRARLSAGTLSPALRRVIDGYFAARRAAVVQGGKPEPPAYMKLYEAENEGIDSSLAANIEADSWALTYRLVGEETSSLDGEPPPSPREEPVASEAPQGYVLPEERLPRLLEAFLLGGEAPGRVSAAAGLPLPLAAEAVNEALLPVLGDVLLMPDGESFCLIEEYREDAETWLKNNKK